MAKVRRAIAKRLVATRGVSEPTPRPPRAWELAPKQAMEASKLVTGRDDTIGRFFLNLALAFNDLKGLVMFEQYLAAMGRPAKEDFSPYFGQWHGVNVQVHRWIVAQLHEVMILINAPQYKSVLAGKELRALVASMPMAVSTSWNRLVAVATAPLNQRGIPSLLTRIRNQAGFHYNYKGMELAASYLSHFGAEAKAKPSGGNETAQYSLANDMDGTRFYFADAAAQNLINGHLAANQKTLQEVFELANDVNIALAALIGAFIASRDT